MSLSVCQPRKRVAVIGAGAAGLAALRHTSCRPEVFEVMCFEQSAVIGGTWVYNDDVGTDQYGLPVHSSMYKNLRTNLPKEAMAFPDFPFEKDGRSFLKHEEVLDYLEKYADHFNLKKYIKFLTEVKHVDPVKDGHGGVTWNIKVKDVRVADDTSDSSFVADAVIVCNGYGVLGRMHFNGSLTKFEGQVIHSHDYRVPEAFANKVVCCVGCGASGQDIALEVASKAKQVYLSHNKPALSTSLPDNLSQTSGIVELTADGGMMKNGQKLEFDVLLLCTGYHYSFPFLSANCHVNIDDGRVTPLYKHIVHTEFPTLFFIGICTKLCPFPQFHNTVKFILATLDGTFQLPPKEDMMAEEQREFEWRLKKGYAHRHAHLMGPLQWDYFNELADLGKYERLPKAVQNLFDEIHRTRCNDLQNYRNINYQITGPETFEVRY
ncbi:flavin-containing monooxygenase FMO GS-OX-like 4 [Lingula anatina]|uniref:Flavin-containing monooxygenase n=1 Tax=Lingula anatina TaxID=7574 RepID=A0A1S3J295_LINAN|nr:flavin-containing monooxygenase FMO GS-OX-like 4 [Lingula anatina]|eukprot:XP_013404525.1 flavin-containing monooxygenase FMO GS-OX-like 4 [Lingula anatina]